MTLARYCFVSVCAEVDYIAVRSRSIEGPGEYVHLKRIMNQTVNRTWTRTCCQVVEHRKWHETVRSVQTQPSLVLDLMLACLLGAALGSQEANSQVSAHTL